MKKIISFSITELLEPRILIEIDIKYINIGYFLFEISRKIFGILDSFEIYIFISDNFYLVSRFRYSSEITKSDVLSHLEN